jgi:hypothetical protein
MTDSLYIYLLFHIGTGGKEQGTEIRRQKHDQGEDTEKVNI